MRHAMLFAGIALVAGGAARAAEPATPEVPLAPGAVLLVRTAGQPERQLRVLQVGGADPDAVIDVQDSATGARYSLPRRVAANWPRAGGTAPPAGTPWRAAPVLGSPPPPPARTASYHDVPPAGGAAPPNNGWPQPGQGRATAFPTSIPMPNQPAPGRAQTSASPASAANVPRVDSVRDLLRLEGDGAAPSPAPPEAPRQPALGWAPARQPAVRPEPPRPAPREVPPPPVTPLPESRPAPPLPSFTPVAGAVVPVQAPRAAEAVPESGAPAAPVLAIQKPNYVPVPVADWVPPQPEAASVAVTPVVAEPAAPAVVAAPPVVVAAAVPLPAPAPAAPRVTVQPATAAPTAFVAAPATSPPPATVAAIEPPPFAPSVTVTPANPVQQVGAWTAAPPVAEIRRAATELPALVPPREPLNTHVAGQLAPTGDAMESEVEPAVRELFTALRPSLRERAATALAECRYGSRPEIKALLARAALLDPAASVRAHCIRKLSALGYHEASYLEYLGSCADSGQPDVKVAAATALARLTPR